MTVRIVEVFGAGCPLCDETIKLVKSVACPSCDVRILDMHDPAVAARASQLGVTHVPGVVVDGRLADCCAGGGVTEDGLRAAGIGTPLVS
jgi:hypothetical protein